MKQKFYTCRYDRTFKEIFLKPDNKDILKVLLESVLKVKIDNIEYLNLENIVDSTKLRKKTYDLRLSTNIGRIQVEVNAHIHDYSRTRQTAYLCNEYSHVTLTGEEYDETTEVIQINFTYGLMTNFEDKYKHLYDDKDIRVYKLMDNKGKFYVNNFKIYEINMDYFFRFWYNKDEENIMKYRYFIMMDLDTEQLKELSKKDEMVGKYMSELNRINKDPRFLEYMSDEEDERKMLNTIKKRVYGDGFDKGLEKGKEEERIELAKKMNEKNIDLSIIEECTKISKEEIEKL